MASRESFPGITDDEFTAVENAVNAWLTSSEDQILSDDDARLVAKVILATAPKDGEENDAITLVSSVANGLPFSRVHLDNLIQHFLMLATSLGDMEMQLMLSALGQWNLLRSENDAKQAAYDQSMAELNDFLASIFGNEEMSEPNDSDWDDGGSTIYVEGDWDEFDISDYAPFDEQEFGEYDYLEDYPENDLGDEWDEGKGNE
jgi:hypothetical protein